MVQRACACVSIGGHPVCVAVYPPRLCPRVCSCLFGRQQGQLHFAMIPSCLQGWARVCLAGSEASTASSRSHPACIGMCVYFAGSKASSIALEEALISGTHLGYHPASGQEVLRKKGPYGPYLELGPPAVAEGDAGEGAAWGDAGTGMEVQAEQGMDGKGKGKKALKKPKKAPKKPKKAAVVRWVIGRVVLDGGGGGAHQGVARFVWCLVCGAYDIGPRCQASLHHLTPWKVGLAQMRRGHVAAAP